MDGDRIQVYGDNFYSWQEFEPLEKASDGRMLIRGIMSSEAVDSDGDVILQDGIDLSYFLAKGAITEEHPVGNTNYVGEPVGASSVTVKGVKATQIDALLYSHIPRAVELWDQSVGMKKSGATRSLGFSLEGKVKKASRGTGARGVRRIVEKSWVHSSAISPVPKNPLTYWQPQIAAAIGRIFSMGPGELVSFETANGTVGDIASLASAIVAQMGQAGFLQALVAELVPDLMRSMAERRAGACALCGPSCACTCTSCDSHCGSCGPSCPCAAGQPALPAGVVGVTPARAKLIQGVPTELLQVARLVSRLPAPGAMTIDGAKRLLASVRTFHDIPVNGEGPA